MNPDENEQKMGIFFSQFYQIIMISGNRNRKRMNVLCAETFQELSFFSIHETDYEWAARQECVRMRTKLLCKRHENFHSNKFNRLTNRVKT